MEKRCNVCLGHKYIVPIDLLWEDDPVRPCPACMQEKGQNKEFGTTKISPLSSKINTEGEYEFRI